MRDTRSLVDHHPSTESFVMGDDTPRPNESRNHSQLSPCLLPTCTPSPDSRGHPRQYNQSHTTGGQQWDPLSDLRTMLARIGPNSATPPHHSASRPRPNPLRPPPNALSLSGERSSRSMTRQVADRHQYPQRRSSSTKCYSSLSPSKSRGRAGPRPQS